MKRIALIIAALVFLLSACYNPIPPPDLDENPVVTLSGPLTASTGSPVTISATVTDDTPGERPYTWHAPGRYVPNPEFVTHATTRGFTMDVEAPSVSNGQLSGHTATYTFNGEPYSIGGEDLDVDLGTNDVTIARGGTDVSLSLGESRTVSYGSGTATLAFIDGAFAEPTLVGARFTIDNEIVDLGFNEMMILTLEGYSVNTTIVDYALASDGSFSYVTIEATYVYDGLLQQQQVKFTPEEGVRISLPEGTIVDAYLEGGVYEQSGTRDAVGGRFEIANETVDLRFGTSTQLSLEGYSVDVEPVSHTLNSAGDMETITVQATYTYDGLLQQQQVRFTPENNGVRIGLPQGTYVDAYFRGGLFETSAETIVLRVNSESEVVPVGSDAYIGDTTVRVLSASGTSTPNGAELTAVLFVGHELIEIDAEGMTLTRPGRLILEYADVSASVNGNTAIVTALSPVDRVFDAYSWQLDNGTLYYADRILFEEISSTSTGVTFTPRRPAAMSFTYTVRDDRGNVGSAAHPIVVS